MRKWFLLVLTVLAFTVPNSVYSAENASNAEKRDEAVAIMKRVAAWQLAHPRHRDTDWHNAPLFAGVLELYKVTNDQKYLEELLTMGNRNEWKPGKRLRHADDHCIGQTYIDLYLIKKDPEMLNPIKNTFDTIISSPKKGRREWWWCDALFMAPPTLARLATATKERKYLDFMDSMWWNTTEHLYDSEEHLYFRDRRFFAKREKNGKKVFWSRGNGWVLGGLCRVLQHMPEDYTKKEKYVSLFKQMSAKVASLQQNDGFWRVSLLDPDSFPAGESSGTAFFTYALAWGINHDLLSREKYMPVVEKGWTALCGAVDDTDRLGWVQPVSDRPKQPEANSSETYGTGAFLLAGCEVIRLLTEHETAGDPANHTP